MGIKRKFLILNAVILAFCLLSIFSFYQISKVSKLIDLNFYHVKYNHDLSDSLLKFEMNTLSDLEIIKNNILLVRHQPLECLRAINDLEHVFMNIIGTGQAIALCKRDIDVANQALITFDSFAKNPKDKKKFLSDMRKNVQQFDDNSDAFEPLINKTVSCVYDLFIIACIVFFVGICTFIYLLTKKIKNDYEAMEQLTKDLDATQTFQNLIMENIPDMVFVKDHNFKIVQANQTFIEAYPPDERDSIIGSTTVEKYNEYEANEFLRQDKIALQEGYTETEETIKFPDGNIRTLLTKKIMFENAQKEKFILGVARDMTEFKFAKTGLENARYFLQNIIDTVADPIFVKDQFHNYVAANQAFLDIIGFSRDNYGDFIGKTDYDFFPKEQADTFQEKDKKVFLTGEIDINEEPITDHKGVTKTISTKKTVFFDSGGQKTLVGVIRDITDIKQVEMDLIEANTELEEFSYRTSHDLRSPIISSISLLQLASDMLNQGDVKEAQESIKHIDNSLNKLQRLIDDILQLTLAKNKEEEIEPVNVSYLVEESLNKFSHLEGYARLDIQQDYRFKGTLQVKRLRLVMIIENLLSNAIKYQDVTKDNSFIKISTYAENGFCIFEILDNGIGIPEEQRNNLFQMFKRFHPKVAFGSGLGLYLMKKSADVLGAKIEFEDPGDGACFKLKIPVV